MALDEEEYQKLKYKAEKFLRENNAFSAEKAKPTLEISKSMFEGATRKKANPVLYRMQKEKVVEKVAEPDGTKPRWFLTPSP